MAQTLTQSTQTLEVHGVDAPRLQLNLRGGPSGTWTHPIRPTKIDDPQAARQHVKERLAAAYRVFHKLGFDDAVSGHITLRDPVNPHCDSAFWLAAYGIPFDKVCASDLLLISHEGKVLEGGRPGEGQIFNSAGFVIHSALHESREDINAAAHAHSRYGKAFAALGRNLDMASYDAAQFKHTIKHYGTFGGVVIEEGEAERLCQALGDDGKAIILQNHGLMSVGDTIEAAVAFYMRLEHLCHSQLLADAAGVPFEIEEDVAAEVFKMGGGEDNAYMEALALFDAVERETGGDYKL